jgi:integrase
MKRRRREIVRVEAEKVEAEPVLEADALELVKASGLAPAAKGFASRSRAENTRRVYGAQWRRFKRWCKIKGVSMRPASKETVANYLAYLATFGREPEVDRALKRRGPLKASSIHQAKAVIGKAHTDAGLPSPTDTYEVKAVWDGIQRTLGAKVAKKAPILPEELAVMLKLAPDSLLGTRDRAILLLGWAGAFRRSELVALDVEDLSPGTEPGSLVANLRRSKTDQLGEGGEKPILPSEDERLCPVRAVAAWLEASRIRTGPLFRAIAPDGRRLLERRLSDDMVYETVLAYAAAAKLDPGRFNGFGAHSLRAGFCTTAAQEGKALDQIQVVTKHAKIDTLLGYIRDVQLFSKRSAGRGLLDRVNRADEPGGEPPKDIPQGDPSRTR